MEFFRQEHWSGLLFPYPGDLPDPGFTGLLHCRWILYCLSPLGKHKVVLYPWSYLLYHRDLLVCFMAFIGIISYSLFACVFFSLLPEWNFMRVGSCLLFNTILLILEFHVSCSTLHPHHLKECLVPSRCSVHL